MMNFLQVFIYTGLLILALMVLLWLFSLALKNTSIVDIFWGIGFVLVNAFLMGVVKSNSLRDWVLTILVTIWGFRLAIHVMIRNAGKGEDFRYRKWREEHGKNWWWFSFFQTFLLQGVILWLVSIPLTASHFYSGTGNLGILGSMGVIVWAVGFYFEAVGDAQLVQFKKDPANKGKLLTRGVWRYSRHPNYFGDATQWWGFYLFALASGGWWSIISPILMTFLLVKVSGVALLEISMRKEKPGYEEYIRKTSSFIPWFPKQ
jgi:steroid 5-alpha reductase family enzyme